MKTFTNLNKMWEYYLFCPLCHGERHIDISVGPDYVGLSNFKKNKDFLTLKLKFLNKDINLQINCDKNTFLFTSNDNIKLSEEEINNLDLFFYINGSCNNINCGDTYLSSMDIEYIDNCMGLLATERETYILTKCKNKYHLSYNYIENNIEVSLLSLEDGKFMPRKPSIIPLINFDFSNQDYVSKKISNILLFK